MIKILTNGVAAEGLDEITIFKSSGNYIPYGIIAPEFDLDVIANGPRSSLVKLNESGRSEQRVGYFSSSQTYAIDFAAIIRADLLLTKGGMQVRFSRTNSAAIDASTTDIGTTLNTIDNGDLIGIDKFGKGYGQDHVQEFASTGNRSGFMVKTLDDSANDESAMFSKLIMGQAFDFGTDKNPAASGSLFTDVPVGAGLAQPLHGDEPYQIEKRFQLTWNQVTSAKVEAFLALPKITEWPFLVYDADAEVFPWKLEHVILENYSATLRAPDVWTIVLNLARLRHYE